MVFLMLNLFLLTERLFKLEKSMFDFGGILAFEIVLSPQYHDFNFNKNKPRVSTVKAKQEMQRITEMASTFRTEIEFLLLGWIQHSSHATCLT